MKPSFVKTIVPKAAATALVSLCLLSANAMANDAVVGAIIGGGAGAFVGHSIGGRDATIIGGALGAAAGAAIGSDRGRTTYVERRVEYNPPPPPRVYYEQPVRVIPATARACKSYRHRSTTSATSISAAITETGVMSTVVSTAESANFTRRRPIQ